jgi:hypothetical protein
MIVPLVRQVLASSVGANVAAAHARKTTGHVPL